MTDNRRSSYMLGSPHLHKVNDFGDEGGFFCLLVVGDSSKALYDKRRYVFYCMWAAPKWSRMTDGWGGQDQRIDAPLSHEKWMFLKNKNIENLGETDKSNDNKSELIFLGGKTRWSFAGKPQTTYTQIKGSNCCRYIVKILIVFSSF